MRPRPSSRACYSLAPCPAPAPRPRAPPASPTSSIVRGAREHNLAIDHLEIPKRQLVVFTGPERLRQIEPRLRHPLRRGPAPLRRDAERLRPPVPGPARAAQGRPPARPVADHRHRAEERLLQPALHRRHHHRDLRLPARPLRQRRRAALPRVREEGQRAQAPQAIARELLALPEGTPAHAPGAARRAPQGRVPRGLRRAARRAASSASRVDGKPSRARGRSPALDKKRKHIDRPRRRPRHRARRATARRIAEAVELALAEGKGELRVEPDERQGRLIFSEARACCGIAFPELSPAELLVQLARSACAPRARAWASATRSTPTSSSPTHRCRSAAGRHRSLGDAPWRAARAGRAHRRRRRARVRASTSTCRGRSSPRRSSDQVLHGAQGKKIADRAGARRAPRASGTWAMKLRGRHPQPRAHASARPTSRRGARACTGKYLRERPCDACGGKRLRPESRAVRRRRQGHRRRHGDDRARRRAEHFNAHRAAHRGQAPSPKARLREIDARLRFLLDVGLDYLTLDRAGPTL